ncbi:MAG TPA: hypothetical protein DCM86_08160, partial [Verrucomicrobiales bacterium]|nr:hypothetical protein [Verrucomicrobiales bacterium]
PELLDWLAADFMAHGWSLKHLHRIIMGSATYRQASVDRAEASRVDPDNRLLGRFPRHRLEAETIRDVELSVAGLLNPRMGGPGIFPELPDGMPAPRGGWRVNEDPSERNRRSVYVFIRRNTRYPMFDSFDMPDPHESCPRRNVTTSPLQALTLLNSRLTLDWARGFAGRVLEAAGRSEELESRVEIAFRMALNRPPDPSERRSACEFLRQQSQLLTPRLARQEPVALPLSMGPEVEPAGAAALVDLCHVLLNTTEFVYVN